MRFTATPHRYVRRSAAQWQALLEAYERSGLSQRTFCQQQGLALGSFVRWRRQLAGDAPEPPGAQNLFVELASSAAAGHGQQPAWDVELQLAEGMVLRLRRRSC
jgi:hypothetical protein